MTVTAASTVSDGMQAALSLLVTVTSLFAMKFQVGLPVMLTRTWAQGQDQGLEISR